MWDKAFLEQARSDWQIYKLLEEQQCCERCHCLHYLQMTTEKLSKAIMSRQQGGGPPPRRHHVFVQMLQTSKKKPRRFATALGMSDHEYIAFVKLVLPIAYAVQALVPSPDDRGPDWDKKENAEYPWITPDGGVVAPSQYDFNAAKELMTPKGRKLGSLVARLIDQFDVL